MYIFFQKKYIKNVPSTGTSFKNILLVQKTVTVKYFGNTRYYGNREVITGNSPSTIVHKTGVVEVNVWKELVGGSEKKSVLLT